MSNKAKCNEKDQQILQAAAKQFAINGFSGARVDEIAIEADVNKATLYYRIGDKAAIYDRVFCDMLDTVLDKIAKNVASADTAQSKLQAFCHAIAEICSNNEYISPFILREAANGGDHMSKNALEKMHQVRLRLGNILEHGVEQGVFKPVNPYMVYIMLIGTLNFFAASQPTDVKDSLQSSTEAHNVRLSLSDVANNMSELILGSIQIH